MEGTVKWFNKKKGYGFIKGDDNEDYFVHYTAVPRGTMLKENDRVSFEGVDGDRGKQAQNVTVAGGQAASKQSEEGDFEEESEESSDQDAEEKAEEDYA